MSKKVYSIPVQWEMEGLMEIEADSLDEAFDVLYQDQDFPKDQYYVDNTFEAQPSFVEKNKDELKERNQ